MPSPSDPQVIVTACLHQLLAELLRSGAEPATLTSTVNVAGWSITIQTLPQAEAQPVLTPCELDILAVLSPTIRMTTTRVLAALEAAGKIHGERTVGGALADLVRDGRILSSKRAPRGYHLPAQMRLFG